MLATNPACCNQGPAAAAQCVGRESLGLLQLNRQSHVAAQECKGTRAVRRRRSWCSSHLNRVGSIDVWARPAKPQDRSSHRKQTSEHCLQPFRWRAQALLYSWDNSAWPCLFLAYCSMHGKMHPPAGCKQRPSGGVPSAQHPLQGPQCNVLSPWHWL